MKTYVELLVNYYNKSSWNFRGSMSRKETGIPVHMRVGSCIVNSKGLLNR